MAWPIVSAIVSLLTTGITTYAEHKKLKAEKTLEIEKAKIKRVQKLDEADADWDTIMAEATDNSWKDEYWTIVLSIPAIGAFIPEAVPHIKAGFDALQTMPEWYRWALGIAVAAAFGFRKLAGFIGNNKNG